LRAVGRTSTAKERLVEATIELVWRHSYGAVGVDAICERAQVKKGSFYHFFGSKDDLLVAALESHWMARKLVLDEIFAPTVPGVARLRRYFRHVYERQMAVRAECGRILGCFYASVGTECIQQSPLIGAKVQSILSEFTRYLEGALKDAHASGALDIPNPAAKARALFAYVEGVLGQARIHNDPEIVKQLEQTGLELVGFRPSQRKGAAQLAEKARGLR
jgi:TetR/AcrR family transcriptional repressor of nem operon